MKEEFDKLLVMATQAMEESITPNQRKESRRLDFSNEEDHRKSSERPTWWQEGTKISTQRHKPPTKKTTRSPHLQTPKLWTPAKTGRLQPSGKQDKKRIRILGRRGKLEGVLRENQKKDKRYTAHANKEANTDISRNKERETGKRGNPWKNAW